MGTRKKEVAICRRIWEKRSTKEGIAHVDLEMGGDHFA